MCLYCILILRFTDFALTSVRCCLLSQGGIHCFVLFPALLYDLFCHCQRCLSDPKRSAWQNKLPSTTPSLYTLPVTPLRSNHLRPKTPDLDRATFSSLLFFVFFFFLSLHWTATEIPTGRKRLGAEHFSGVSAAQLLLIDSSKGSKAPFTLGYPTVFPYKLCYMHFQDFPSLPVFSPGARDGEISVVPVQRETGGWLSEVKEGITEEVGSGDRIRGVWVK